MALISKKRLVLTGLLLVLLATAAGAGSIALVSKTLPEIITVADYRPRTREVSEVFDRKGQKIGEFFNEKRIIIEYKDIPQKLVHAFISAEDSSFFKHDGLNYLAIVRAALANLRAGRKVQGGSTITQQVARSLLLSREKTYIRKIKEALLSYKMEANLSKEDILYMYLNQIYLGQGAYGVEAAAKVYFRKSAKDLTVPECAILAGLPQAPSRYSPTKNPQSAKERQRYVLSRMAEEGYITREEAQRFAEEPVKVYLWENYKEVAPFYLEVVRQMLVAKLGDEVVLDRGIRVETAADLRLQESAQKEVQEGLRELDKRQGFRGPKENLDSTEKVASFLLRSRNELIDQSSQERILRPDGTFEEKGPLNLNGKDAKGEPIPNLPKYLRIDQIVPAVVTKVDDTWGLVHVRFAESRGMIDMDTMTWARKPDTNVRYDAALIKKPSQALKVGDVIDVRVVQKSFSSTRLQQELSAWRSKNKGSTTPKDFPILSDFAGVELEQDPVSEGALVSIDQNNGDIVALVGGYDFTRSEFNRAIQALRQTGSSFKSLVYASALDKGFTPASRLLDVPLVYEESDKAGGDEGQDAESLATKKWRPANHSKSFAGEVLFRHALIHSLNVPTVKLTESLGVDWVAAYARRLGIFSPLNMDFTIALGSSGVTVYEMTKAFATLAKLGRRVTPLLIHRVQSRTGQVLLENVSLDERFAAEIDRANKELEEKYDSVKDDESETEQEGESNEPLAASESDKDEDAEPASDEGEQRELESAKKLAAAKKRKKPLIFFKDKDQLIRPETAYVITTILQGVIDEPGGTGGAARSLGRPAAGKTGSTSGYYDAWFIGYTPNLTTSVWVGFDQEKSLGRGEVGGKAALPIWLGYMKTAHQDLPTKTFSVPDGIVFANIDANTGRLASASSKEIVRQSFIEGTEPTASGGSNSVNAREDEQQFLKEDLSQ